MGDYGTFLLYHSPLVPSTKDSFLIGYTLQKLGALLEHEFLKYRMQKDSQENIAYRGDDLHRYDCIPQPLQLLM